MPQHHNAMQEHTFRFTRAELRETWGLRRYLIEKAGDAFSKDDAAKLMDSLRTAVATGLVHRDVFGLNPIVTALETARICVDEIGLRRDSVIATLLYACQVTDYGGVRAK